MSTTHFYPEVLKKDVRRGLCDSGVGTPIRDTGDSRGILVRALMGFKKTDFSEARSS